MPKFRHGRMRTAAAASEVVLNGKSRDARKKMRLVLPSLLRALGDKCRDVYLSGMWPEIPHCPKRRDIGA
jgi:hypothetical protein